MDAKQYAEMEASGLAPCGCPRVVGPQAPGDTDTHSCLHGPECTIEKLPPAVPVYPEDELATLRAELAKLKKEKKPMK